MRPKRSRKWLSAGVSSALVCVGMYVVSPSAAQAAPSAPLSAYSEAEQQDLALIARSKGIPLEQAANDFGWQNAFALLATEIEEDHPDTFAGAAIEDPGKRQASIAFAGVAPAEAIKAVAEASLADVSIEVVGGRPWSIRELDERMIAVHRAISARSELVTSVSTTYDHETGSIATEVAPVNLAVARESAATDLLIKELLSTVPEDVRSSVADVAVRNDLKNTPEAVVGGGRIEWAGSGQLECSGGFTIKHSSQVTGIVTAGHCRNTSLTYENFDGASEDAMNHGGGSAGGEWGDFQWHRVDDTENDDFYANDNVLRDVTGVAHPVMNQTLCRYGQSFQADCADVQDLSACASGSAEGGYEVCRLVRTDNDISDGGDSGGPWYYGNTAYGVHWGTFGTWLGDRSSFSRVMYMYDAINTAVLR